MSEAPTRRFLFLAGYRLDELHGQSVSWAARQRQRVKGLGFSFLTIGGSLDTAPPDARVKLYREIERIRRHLEDSGELGGLDEAGEHQYVHGYLSMYAVPFAEVNPATLYMVGETTRTYVAIGGQLKDVVNRDADFAKAAEDAPRIMVEREVARAVARAKLVDDLYGADEEPPVDPDMHSRWEDDVVGSYRRFGDYPERYRKKDYEILALRDEFSSAEELAPQHAKAVLLGKPLFVAFR